MDAIAITAQVMLFVVANPFKTKPWSAGNSSSGSMLVQLFSQDYGIRGFWCNLPERVNPFDNALPTIFRVLHRGGLMSLTTTYFYRHN
jgi:hypothetical protein